MIKKGVKIFVKKYALKALQQLNLKEDICVRNFSNFSNNIVPFKVLTHPFLRAYSNSVDEYTRI